MTVAGWIRTTMSYIFDTSQLLSATANAVLLFLGQFTVNSMM